MVIDPFGYPFGWSPCNHWLVCRCNFTSAAPVSHHVHAATRLETPFFSIVSNVNKEELNKRLGTVCLSPMKVVRYLKNDQSKFTAKQVLTYLRNDLRNVGELHCEGGLSDNDVCELCRILRNNPADVNLRVLYIANSGLGVKSAEAIASVLYTNETIEVLDLRHNKLGAEGVEKLIQPLLSANRKLKCLILKANNLFHKAGKQLGLLLSRNHSIEELHLGHNELGTKGIKPIASSIGRGLQKLHLAHNHLKARGVQILASALQKTKHELVFLDLTCNQMGSKGMHTLVEWLMMHREKTLERLWLGSNDLGGETCGSMWSSILEFNSTLTDIRLGGNRLGDAGAEALSIGLSKNRCLRLLELDWNQISDDGAEALASSLRMNEALRVVDLSGNQVGQRGCIALAEAIPYHLTLRELNLTNNRMNDQAAKSFAQLLTERHCCFDKLICDENPLSQEGVKMLTHAADHRKNLRRWFTTKFIEQIQGNRVAVLNWLSKQHISDYEVTKLASILIEAEVHRLTTIYIGGVEITAKGIEALSEWIASPSCSLTRLFIRGTSMGDAGASALADALESNTSLRELSLTGSNITATGAALLGRALMENETLTRLSLANNRISCNGLVSLARGAQHSSTLNSLNAMSNKIEIPKSSVVWDELVKTSIKELTLRDNSIDDDIIVEFAHALRDQCPFQKLDFIENRITDKGAWLLSKILEEYNVDFHY